MKLVSPKALLASLLGILFVIAKAMTFMESLICFGWLPLDILPSRG